MACHEDATVDDLDLDESDDAAIDLPFRSVREKRTARRVKQQVSRHAAEHPFAQTAMPVGAGNHEVGASILKNGLQTRSFVSAGRDGMRLCGDPMLSKPSYDVVQARPAGGRIIFDRHLDNIDVARLFQKLDRVRNRPSCFARIFPQDHNTLQKKASHVRRYDEDRASRLYDELPGIEASRRRPIVRWRRSHDEVGTPCRTRQVLR